jgi:hypothetical protein
MIFVLSPRGRGRKREMRPCVPYVVGTQLGTHFPPTPSAPSQHPPTCTKIGDNMIDHPHTVEVPITILRQAIFKAWAEYRHFRLDADPSECWAEFQALASFAEGDDDWSPT